jgi:hypothetical protein
MEGHLKIGNSWRGLEWSYSKLSFKWKIMVGVV